MDVSLRVCVFEVVPMVLPCFSPNAAHSKISFGRSGACLNVALPEMGQRGLRVCGSLAGGGCPRLFKVQDGTVWETGAAPCIYNWLVGSVLGHPGEMSYFSQQHPEQALTLLCALNPALNDVT